MSRPPVVEFFFDIGSPYSYLSATQMLPLAKRTGTEVCWRPFLLGGVFKATGNEMPARVPAKAAWMLEDLGRWARQVDAPLRFPSRFPLNTLRCQRALTATHLAEPQQVPAFALALYRAYWADDRDVSTEEEIGRTAGEVGLDAATILVAATDDATKAALRACTEEAVTRGAFGAPTFFVGNEMYWGNDRLHQLEQRLTQAE